MRDMGGHHFSGQAHAGLRIGNQPFGFFQSNDRAFKLAVRAGQIFGVFEQCLRELLGPAAQQLFLPLHVRYVSIDGHPSAIGQRRAFDADPAPVFALAFHVMWLKGKRAFDALFYQRFDVLHVAIFTACRDNPNGFLKARAGAHQVIRDLKHLAKPLVGHHKAQLAVIDRQSLFDQVQTGYCHGLNNGLR